MTFREFWRWYQEGKGDNNYVDLLPETLVLCSSPKAIQAEYRTFLLDKRVLASSRYLPEPAPSVAPEVAEFAEGIAARYAPADAFVLDIALTESGLKVIEFNCINGSGFYLADLGRIVRSLSSWQEGRFAMQPSS